MATSSAAAAAIAPQTVGTTSDVKATLAPVVSIGRILVGTPGYWSASIGIVNVLIDVYTCLSCREPMQNFGRNEQAKRLPLMFAGNNLNHDKSN